MRVHYPGGSYFEIPVKECRLEEVLSTLGLNPLELIVSRNGAIIPEDSIVGDTDELRIYRVAHGG
jgi:sulfur carrier protein ThiS